MATLTTKFGVGDTVFHATTTTERRQHDCPDCLGAREWSCASPAGGEFKVPCPRCSAQYQSNSELSLTYSWHVPVATELTVGLVRASSMLGDDWGQGNDYMCLETGVGSGSIYREDKLFATRDEALAAARAVATANNHDAGQWVAKQYAVSAKFADYELKDALMEAAISKSRRALYDVQHLLESLDEAETLDEVRGRITDWREKLSDAEAA